MVPLSSSRLAANAVTFLIRPACAILAGVLLFAAQSLCCGGPASAADTAFAFSPASAKLPYDARISEKIYGLPGLGNVGRIARGFFRGDQPGRAGYDTLRDMGIKTVINLRAGQDERKYVEQAGMNYMEFPIDNLRTLKKSLVREIFNAIMHSSNQPVYLHCALGKDRTGLIVAFYRIEVDDWNIEEADKEMRDFGFSEALLTLRDFVSNYQKGD